MHGWHAVGGQGCGKLAMTHTVSLLLPTGVYGALSMPPTQQQQQQCGSGIYVWAVRAVWEALRGAWASNPCWILLT